jgi:hypothetical protein
MYKPTVLLQRLPAAVQHKAGDCDVIAGLGGQQRRTARKDKTRGAAHAEQLCAVRKPEVARAVDAWHQYQWCARARGLIDRTLQSPALVVQRPRPNAELRRIDPIGRKRHGQCGGAGEGANQEAAAVDGHGTLMMRPGS